MSASKRSKTIDELLDRAVQAINRGDRATADSLAEQVLSVDQANPDAEDLLSALTAGIDELRRLTILFADVVNSTALSTRIEPEIYHAVIGRYRREVNTAVERYEGHVCSTKGDGLLAVFGHPVAHENDLRRAVQAGLDITRAVAELSRRVHDRFGFEISVRVGVHRGLVYLDVAQDDVYGLGANLAARVCGLAPPGGVVVSGALAPLVCSHFDLEQRPAQPVKGIDEPVEHYLVTGEHIGRPLSPLGPLIGREREMARLRADWALAVHDSLSTPGIGFSGEAGIGKSRLVAAAIDVAEQSGAEVLALIGSPFQVEAGLYPIRTLLEQRCGITRATEHADRLRLLESEVRARGLDAAQIVPLLAPVLGIVPEHGYQPVPIAGDKLYQQIIDAITGYLLACAGGGPLLVIAEDLQWFDPSSDDVITALLRCGTGRLLAVLTGRDLAALPDVAGLDVVELAPLTVEQTDQLLTALDPTLSADERADVQRRCDGVPLYIEEVVAKIHEQPTDAASWTRAPDALYEPLFSRLRASATTIQVVEAAATIGRQFDHALLCGVLGMADDELDTAIAALQRARVFEQTGLGRWWFRHELLREVAYELPPPSLRRSLHGRIADELVAVSQDPDWHLVARHYQSAERFVEAADAHQRAAQDARRRGALGEARDCLSRAIAQIERAAPGRARDERETGLRLQRGFLSTAVEGGVSPRATADFERCLQLAEAGLNAATLQSTLMALWGYYLSRGDLRRCLQVTESNSVGTGVQRHLSWFQPIKDTALGTIALFGGEFGRARALLEDCAAALAGNDLAGFESIYFIPCDPLTSLHTHLALARFVQGDLSGAEEQLGETVRRVLEIGFPQGPFSHAYQRYFEIWLHIESGRLDRAAQITAELAAQGERHGFEYWVMLAGVARAVLAALAALDGADGGPEPTVLQPHIQLITAIVANMRAADLTLFIAFYCGVLARLLIAAGRPGEAREQLDCALESGQATDANFFRTELLRLRARTGADPEARDADLHAAVELARTTGATIFELRAAVDLFELRGPTQRATLAGAISRFPAGSDWPELDGARALLG